MRFWDSSAVIPPIIQESPRDRLLDLLGGDSVMVVWGATPVECVSALACRERESALTALEVGQALTALRSLAASWQEIIPSESVRTLALRLLRVHAVRAADSLQLAAASTPVWPAAAS